MKILITGASEGIGLEVAKLLAMDNNEITLVARSKDKLEEAVGLLNGNGHRIIVADLSKRQDVDALKDTMQENKYGVFINNAGVGMYGRFTELPLSDQEKMLALNITALTVLSYCYLQQATKGDALVNVASVLGTTSYPGAAVYSASKAYVTNFSESLWWEYKTKGIYVVGFCPGPTYTEFHNAAGGDKNNFPRFVMQSGEQVAKRLVHALLKRSRPKIVSGNFSHAMIFLQKLMTRTMAVNMMGSFTPIKDSAE